jgi:hypothetical protein
MILQTTSAVKAYRTGAVGWQFSPEFATEPPFGLFKLSVTILYISPDAAGIGRRAVALLGS